MGQVQSFGILNKGSGLRPSGFTRQATSARLAGDVIQVWVNSSPSNRCISHFKAQLAQLYFIQHLKCTHWIKGIPIISTVLRQLFAWSRRRTELVTSWYRRTRFNLHVVFVCLYTTPSQYHHCAKLSEDIELIKWLSDILCRVCGYD